MTQNPAARASMDIRFRYTKHQVARGAFADATETGTILLLKNTSSLRLTYQIRLLTFRAINEKKRLVIEVPRHCKVDRSLSEFVKAQKVVRIEKV
jgi:hypothetical protein